MSNIKINPKPIERDKELEKIGFAKPAKEHWIKILSNCEAAGVSSLTVKRFIKYYLKEVEVCNVDTII